MTTENAQLILTPPDADFVLVVSASWWIWTAFALFLVLIFAAIYERTKAKEPSQND